MSPINRQCETYEYTYDSAPHTLPLIIAALEKRCHRLSLPSIVAALAQRCPRLVLPSTSAAFDLVLPSITGSAKFRAT